MNNRTSDIEYRSNLFLHSVFDIYYAKFKKCLDKKIICLVTLFVVLFSTNVLAGPPYDTDDPQPVDLHHWEFYCSTQILGSGNLQMGAAPLVEVNYGAVHNLQLHALTQLYLFNSEGMKTNYGYGDLELGAKYRLVKEDTGSICPQISIYPAVELPTGNAAEGLGNGKTQFYFPVWIEKTTGKWTTNTGGGYWINPGPGNKNFGFVGLQTQYQFAKNVSIGGEIMYVTASEVNGYESDTPVIPSATTNDFKFNIGTIIDLSDHHHLLFSIGRSIIGKTKFQSYLGYQLTI